MNPQIEMAMAELESAMESSIPDYKNKLRDIHSMLLADPETVTLMTDEQIGLVVRGLIQFSGEELVAAEAKKSKSSKLKADDLGAF